MNEYQKKAEKVGAWLGANRGKVSQSDVATIIGAHSSDLSKALRIDRYMTILDDAMRYVELQEGK